MSFFKENNGLNQSLFLVFFILIFLLGYSFLYDNLPFVQNHFKAIPKLQSNTQILKRDVNVNNNQKLKNAVVYALEMKKFEQLQIEMDSIKLYNSYDGNKFLERFVVALETASSDKVRVAYIGDSSIEGDLMSMSLRKFLQNKFGGQGVGFVPITSNVAGFRTTITHSFSDNWEYASIVKGNSSPFDYGFSGEIFYPEIDSLATDSIKKLWVKYTSKSNGFLNTKLFYGKNDSTKNKPNILFFNNQKFTLNEKNDLNIIELSNETTKHVKIDFELNHPIPFYGVSVESNNGVLVDNFSSRGNSGMPLSKIPAKMIKDFNAEMEYDLVILQFGLNALSKSDEEKYHWYEVSMQRVVNYYKNLMPNTSFLFVSVGDKSEKNEDGIMETSPGIEAMVDVQRKVARDTEISFFNMYEAMGGKNSMVKWVDELKWANKDYTHFNYQGSNIMADSLYQFIMRVYDEKNVE